MGYPPLDLSDAWEGVDEPRHPDEERDGEPYDERGDDGPTLEPHTKEHPKDKREHPLGTEKLKSLFHGLLRFGRGGSVSTLQLGFHLGEEVLHERLDTGAERPTEQELVKERDCSHDVDGVLVFLDERDGIL